MISDCIVNDHLIFTGFHTEDEVNAILNSFSNVINTYGCASIMDMYDLIGIDMSETVHMWFGLSNHYGWINVEDATVKKINKGWSISMAKAMPLN